MGNFEKWKIEVGSLKWILRIRNKAVNKTRVERFIVKIDQKNSSGGKESDCIEDKIYNEKNDGGIAFFDFFGKQNVLFTLIFHLLKGIFKFTEGG